MPQRIQRQRTKGWRMPEGAVYVGRPTRWGNPFVVQPASSKKSGPLDMWGVWLLGRCLSRFDDRLNAQADSVDRYRAMWREAPRHVIPEERQELAGMDLACWCPLDQPCHADVLLELVNGGAA